MFVWYIKKVPQLIMVAFQIINHCKSKTTAYSPTTGDIGFELKVGEVGEEELDVNLLQKKQGGGIKNLYLCQYAEVDRDAERKRERMENGWMYSERNREREKCKEGGKNVQRVILERKWEKQRKSGERESVRGRQEKGGRGGRGKRNVWKDEERGKYQAFSFDACDCTRANLSARAICRTHSSFNPSFMFTSAIFE